LKLRYQDIRIKIGQNFVISILQHNHFRLNFCIIKPKVKSQLFLVLLLFEKQKDVERDAEDIKKFYPEIKILPDRNYLPINHGRINNKLQNKLSKLNLC